MLSKEQISHLSPANIKAIIDGCGDEILKLHVQLENTNNSADDTAALRGQIAAFRRIMKQFEPPRVVKDRGIPAGGSYGEPVRRKKQDGF